MFPDRKTAILELEEAGRMNPGPWTAHSLHTAEAAERIAGAAGMDSEKAFVCGLLHDIGRREGVSSMRHIIDGYDYAMSRGWDEIAQICLTHSFPVRDIATDIGKKDVTAEQYVFIKNFLERVEYDRYDKLVILCDALAEAGGFCILEKRLIDTARRYGVYPFSVERWNRTFAYKAEFEELVGRPLYALLPGIEACIYR